MCNNTNKNYIGQPHKKVFCNLWCKEPGDSSFRFASLRMTELLCERKVVERGARNLWEWKIKPSETKVTVKIRRGTFKVKMKYQ